MRAKLSDGNTKLGTVPNISLPPITTCMRKAPCAKLCYAMKSQRMYQATRDMRAHNLRAFRRSPDDYFTSIADQTAGMPFFRWHVAGDIVDALYLAGIVGVARANPGTKYLVFTKRYDLVNEYLGGGSVDRRGKVKLPSNLAIVFSAWPGLDMDNRHSLPVAYMVPKDGSEGRIDGTEIECPGNCETCGMCWSLRTLGRNVAFHQH
jgi:hypothetical protein